MSAVCSTARSSRNWRESILISTSGLRLSRPEPGWTGRTGHVQKHLREAVGDRRDINVFICGLKAMVDDVRSILKACGFDRKHIIYEKYD